MSLENRAKATAKNVEGKIQESVGDLTGDTKDQLEGKSKQAEAKVRHAAEDVKDNVKKAIDQYFYCRGNSQIASAKAALMTSLNY